MKEYWIIDRDNKSTTIFALENDVELTSEDIRDPIALAEHITGRYHTADEH